MVLDACKERQGKIGQVGKYIVRPVRQVRGRVLIESVHPPGVEFIAEKTDHAIITDLVIPRSVPCVQPEGGGPGQELQKSGAYKGREYDQDPE